MADNGFIDLNGTPMLLATGNNRLVLGTQGTGSIRLLTNNTPAIDIDSNGSVALKVANPASGNPTAVDNNGTIDTTKPVQRVKTSSAADKTGAILEAGTTHGQLCLVVNESANTITMAAAATSHVADGISCVIAANAAQLFIWNALVATPIWYKC